MCGILNLQVVGLCDGEYSRGGGFLNQSDGMREWSSER